MPYQKIIFLLVAMLLTSGISHGQNRTLSDDDLNHSTVSKMSLADTTTCDEINEWVKSDIKNKTIFLFLAGGIAPVQYTTDKEFENKYKVYFHDFGDTSPNFKCLIKYNNIVFDYLIRTYGKRWKREIRKDVIGFSNWKKQNR